MKFKPLYIYLGLFIIIILAIVYNSNTQVNITDESMPQDEIHNNLQNESVPGKGNVSSSFKHQMEMLQKAYEENPTDTVKAREYAELLASAHNPQKAVDIYKSILNIDPKRIDILLGITFAYYNMKEMDKAEEYTNKVLQIDKNNQEANYNLGAIQAGRGNTLKAKAIWEDVIKRFPNSNVAQIAENSLKMLSK